MEKKLFKAIFLSFIVLYAWSYLVVGPQKQKEQLLKAQVAENEEVTTKLSLSDTPVQTASSPTLAPNQIKATAKESIQIAETDQLIADFSNFGGNIDTLTIKAFNHKLPLSKMMNISGYENIEFKLEESARNFVAYSYSNDDFKIVKRYYMSEDQQTIDAEIDITNKSSMSKLVNLDIDSFQIDLSRLDNANQRYKMLLEYSVSHNGSIDRKKNLSKFSDKETKSVAGSINWIGFRDQYFCSIVKPDFEIKEYYIKKIDQENARLGIKTKELRIEPGSKEVLKFLIYNGSQDKKVLKSYDNDFEKIINYSIGGFFDFMAFKQTDAIAKLMMLLLQFLHRIIPNWGVSIILFAFCIYGMTYPLTRKTMTSMKKLQEHQPELMKIREKHKSNPQKMNKETMEYYKKYKVNPLGGCLPMLLQMPIFISLYQLLWRAYIFKGASFLWIRDLSEPDRLFTLPFNLPYFGNEFNILPIVYAISMFFQQKMQSKNMTVSDPVQAQTQQMMAKIFPVMLGVIFYKFASGLTLYFTTYFMLTAATQWRMSRQKKDK